MKPLRDIIAKNMNNQALASSKVEFEVGVVSAQSGKYESKNLSSVSENNKQAIDWIWASCVFPIMFSPVEINGEQWVDGGVRNTIPIKDVMKYDVSEIDVVLTDPVGGHAKAINEKIISATDMGLRMAGLMADEVYINDLQVSCDMKSIKLNVYAPEVLIETDSFDFSPKEIRKNMELGYKTTKQKISTTKK
jgi:predicted acylesterase/phospholipase RssA